MEPAFPKCRIGTVDVAVLDREAALQRIMASLDTRASLMIAFCNAHTANMAHADTGFAAAMQDALVLNDGIGVELGSRLLYGAPFPDNLNGTDLTTQLLGSSAKPRRIFLLGSAPGIAERAAVEILRRFPQHIVVGTQHGFFTEEESGAMAARIRALDVDLLLIGMGHPRQEMFAARHWREVEGVTMCIGAWIDFTAGAVSRAPRLVRSLRAEWLYRLALEPRRLARRYLLGNATFLLAVLRQRIEKKSGAD